MYRFRREGWLALSAVILLFASTFHLKTPSPSVFLQPGDDQDSSELKTLEAQRRDIRSAISRDEHGGSVPVKSQLRDDHIEACGKLCRTRKMILSARKGRKPTS
eukprot:751891-Hanusia_phi.AAC.3